MAQSPYDIGLIFPLAEEFDYAREIMSFDAPVIEDGRYFHPFDIPGTRFKGMAAVLHDMGLASATLVAADLLNRFRVRMLALVGIAGALDDELMLGDVVIASRVEEYLPGVKAESVPGEGDRYELVHAGNPWNISADMLAYVRNFRYTPEGHLLHQAWQREAEERRQQVGPPGGLVRESPQYHVRPIASGDVVVAAESFAQWIKSRNRQLAAVEMEGGGVARTFYNDRSGVELLIIRGISDFADDRKRALDRAAGTQVARGAWRQYATRNAVGLFRALVGEPGFRLPERAAGEGSGPSARRLPSLGGAVVVERAVEYVIDQFSDSGAEPPSDVPQSPPAPDPAAAQQAVRSSAASEPSTGPSDPFAQGGAPASADGWPGSPAADDSWSAATADHVDADGHRGDLDGGWGDTAHGGDYGDYA